MYLCSVKWTCNLTFTWVCFGSNDCNLLAFEEMLRSTGLPDCSGVVAGILYERMNCAPSGNTARAQRSFNQSSFAIIKFQTIALLLYLIENKLSWDWHPLGAPHLWESSDVTKALLPWIRPPVPHGPCVCACCGVCAGDPPARTRPAPSLRTGNAPAAPDRWTSTASVGTRPPGRLRECGRHFKTMTSGTSLATLTHAWYG